MELSYNRQFIYFAVETIFNLKKFWALPQYLNGLY